MKLSFPEAKAPYSLTSTPSQICNISLGKREEKDESPVKPLPQIVSLKEQGVLACMELEKKARELGLLLSNQGESKDLCGLLWNPKMVVEKDLVGLAEEGHNFEQYIRTDLMKDRTAGQMLVLPTMAHYLPLSLHINNSRYTLVNVIVRRLDRNGTFLSCNSFDVHKEGISLGDSATFPFTEGQACCFFSMILHMNVSRLPSGVTTDTGEALSLKYDYGIYRYDGSLQSSFDIKHLSILHDFSVTNPVSAMFNEMNNGILIVKQTAALIRFLQLWNAIQKEESHFGNSKLEEIRAKVKALEGDNIKEKAAKMNELLVKACEFLQPHIDIMEGYKRCHSFLSSLKTEEPTMWNARFLGPRNPFYDGSKGDGKVRDDPL